MSLTSRHYHVPRDVVSLTGTVSTVTVVSATTADWMRAIGPSLDASTPPRKLVWSPPPGAPKKRKPFP